MNSFFEAFLTPERASRYYKYFIETVISDHSLFENTTPSDIINIAELPYPLYNDVVLKQYEVKKKQYKEMEQKKRVGRTTR